MDQEAASCRDKSATVSGSVGGISGGWLLVLDQHCSSGPKEANFPLENIITRVNNAIALVGAQTAHNPVLRRLADHRHIGGMATPPPPYSAADVAPTVFRVVTSAQKPGSRKYVWAIVRNDTAQSVVRRSAETFVTMEEAHTHGSAALRQLLSSR